MLLMSPTFRQMNTITFDLETYAHQIDFSGYVSNLTYLQWMEVAQQKLLEAVALPVHRVSDHGILVMLVQAEVQYCRRASLGERIQTELWLTALHSSSMTLKIQFFNDNGSLVAEGSRQELFIDAVTQRPKQLTPELQSYFQPYLRKG